MHMVRITFTVNGHHQTIEIPSHITALSVLRDCLGLKGTKEGCGIGECGACTVVIDGDAVNACLVLGAQLDGTVVTTVEGLGSETKLHPIQAAFVEKHAVQCGFCTPGLLMSTHALLAANPTPTRNEIQKAIAGNLCRCTGYHHIFSSVQAVVDEAANAERKKPSGEANHG